MTIPTDCPTREKAGWTGDVLCDYGYEESAWKILWQKKCPSWLYEIECRSTTMWENWDAIREAVERCNAKLYNILL
ncbi:hypothetical protein DXB97_09315 [Firmicutes bacterium OM07-11]|nr:hypothetical protein DXB97_09315 [Firmicutes bacterium OM07-11]